MAKKTWARKSPGSAVILGIAFTTLPLVAISGDSGRCCFPSRWGRSNAQNGFGQKSNTNAKQSIPAGRSGRDRHGVRWEYL
jgi:hypothetical protein